MPYSPTSEAITRSTFLRSLGLSSAALATLYFSSCHHKTVEPAAPEDGTDSPALVQGNTDPNTGKVDFTIDLTRPENAKLQTVGQFVSANLIVIAHTRQDTYVALLSVCTHAGGSLWYRVSQNDFRCLDHGGLFNTDGSVKHSPPTLPVRTFTVEVNFDKKMLHIHD